MYTFNFRDKDSYLDFGIVVEKRPPITKPEKNIQYNEIPGRSGSLKIDDKTYKDIIIPVQCSFVSNSMNYSTDDVKAWLDGEEDKIIFSNQPDRYYIAHVSNQIDIVQELEIFGRFLVNFRCKPFGYALENPVITLLSTPTTIFNSYTKDSKPVIKVYGNGTIDLTINNKVIHLTNVVDYVTIDSVLMDCYKDTALMNNNMLGEFPTLLIGTNTISWTGTVTKLEVTPNWRYL